MDEQENSGEEFTRTQVQHEEPQHLHSPADSPCSVGENSSANLIEHSIHDNERDGVCSVTLIPSTALASSSQDEAQMEPPYSDLNQLELDKPESRQCSISDNSSPPSPTDILNSSEPSEPELLEVLCRQSLSLVYSTIDENYPEGTLQLLSDLLQPGYYPPRDITSHLLRGILLDQQSPHHLCVQAFKLLMRSQRHHMADKNTVPWDWELLTSIMTNQVLTHKSCDVVRMLLEYVVQTLEDDFRAKRSTSSLHHSIAKAVLSCDQQFPRVREVIKWLFSAIMKSTEHGENRETTREREQMRMVSSLQRMLSLALEVDCSPALTSAKLSQELFHMLISNVSIRAHRMLLLESLQSKLLRCKLLEHLLDYACPVKVSLPMSLSLLLHFLKNCTLAPDPMVNITLLIVVVIFMSLASFFMDKVLKCPCYAFEGVSTVLWCHLPSFPH
uniref:Uncharacterized protein n=1 Tax=Amphilophus citrinellus TaxID=61819 RepID=A0A3Q0SM53_AMPCI